MDEENISVEAMIWSPIKSKTSQLWRAARGHLAIWVPAKREVEESLAGTAPGSVALDAYQGCWTLRTPKPECSPATLQNSWYEFSVWQESLLINQSLKPIFFLEFSNCYSFLCPWGLGFSLASRWAKRCVNRCSYRISYWVHIWGDSKA